MIIYCKVYIRRVKKKYDRDSYLTTIGLEQSYRIRQKDICKDATHLSFYLKYRVIALELQLLENFQIRRSKRVTHEVIRNNNTIIVSHVSPIKQ